MANFNEAFNSNFENMVNINNNDVIDNFFTQRKVTEYEEYIDEKTMQRKKKKKDIVYNFLALNIPYSLHVNNDNISIDINIWGDEGFKHNGTLKNLNGSFPGLIFKLSTDKRVFINLKILFENEDKKEQKEYVTFIDIPKRYQLEPKINS